MYAVFRFINFEELREREGEREEGRNELDFENGYWVAGGLICEKKSKTEELRQTERDRVHSTLTVEMILLFV